MAGLDGRLAESMTAAEFACDVAPFVHFYQRLQT
jgi:hypothetical protein